MNHRMYPIAKRIFDLVLCLVSLPLLLPIGVLVACAIACTMGFPVLFSQSRTGLHERSFTLRKFRTMRTPDAVRRDDASRLTRLGRFLRSSSLDELPTLWNVLRGDMSLVGPRPLLPEYLPLYSPMERRRHEVKPGVTGWAQVNGRNAIRWDERLRLDVWYVEHRSWWLDIWILMMTVSCVVRGTGVSAPGEATMRPFTGSNGGSSSLGPDP